MRRLDKDTATAELCTVPEPVIGLPHTGADSGFQLRRGVNFMKDAEVYLKGLS